MQRCELDLLEADVYASGLLLYKVTVRPHEGDGWMTWRFALSAEKAALGAAGLSKSLAG
jgi:hypothetical protein